MARTFREVRQYQFPSEAHMWEAEAIARSVIGGVVRSATGESGEYVSMDAGSTVTTTGEDFDAVLDELAEDGMTPTRTYVAFYGKNDYYTSPSTVVADRQSRDLSIEILGSDEGMVLGLAAKLDRLLPPLAKSDAPLGVVTAGPRRSANPRAADPRAAAGSDAPAPAGSDAPAAPQVAPDTGSWLRRTWRDHTATFLVTVVGTVVAALILVWAFGIG